MIDPRTFLLAVAPQAAAEPRAGVVETAAFLVALLAGLCVWAWLFTRRRRGVPLVAYEPRRQVPWTGRHALAIVLGHRIALELAPLVIAGVLGISPLPAAGAGPPAHAATDHPVSQLLREQPGLGTLLACIVAVALVAPVVEEFVFRIVLQGWLEAEEVRGRRLHPGERRLPRGAASIGLVSLVFALLHYRTAGPAVSSQFLLASVIGSGVANLLVLGGGVWLLRRTAGTTWADLGLTPVRLRRDVCLGLVAFLAAAPLVYVTQALALLLVPQWMAADPAGLFVFALALGLLYFRTHRAVPVMVVHMALNATTLALLVLMR
jgi:membrane protease YdiL (CAAX protease family)